MSHLSGDTCGALSPIQLPPPWWATWELWWTPAPPDWGEAVLFDSKATSRLVTDMWGDGDGSSRGQCPKVPQVQSPQPRVLAPLCWSLGPGTLGPDSWVCLALVPLTERPRWLGGTPPGDPSIHGVSWTGAGFRQLWCPAYPAANFAGQSATWTRACAAWPASGSSVWCPFRWHKAQ